MTIQKLIHRLNWKVKAAAHVVAYYQSDPKVRLPWCWDQPVPSIKHLAWHYDHGKLRGVDAAWILSDGTTIDLYTNLHSFEHIMSGTLIVGRLDQESRYIKLPSMGMSRLYRTIVQWSGQ